MQSPTAHPQLPDPHDPPISAASSESGIATPSSIPTHPYLLPDGKYECPLCPMGTRKRFRSLATLQKHMLSPIAHMPKIYQCPDPEVFGIILQPGMKRKPQKHFTTFSGLLQHVEYGACTGGKSMFKSMVEFINERLGGLGLGEMRIPAAEQ
ncbi:unnamed protein product [Tuber aestivum]|uniref:C2H2-type domain-containing protein n=1 Tax=Tuber aestivum TaxID=59557 RepID=A0A292PT88_9PEZI|nr:unnamed protein product [Tuber aestivum]